MESERLYDCVITYHLVTGQVLAETYKKDIPNQVWGVVKDKYTDSDAAIELELSEVNVLLPKSNISYITMKVCS